jgi:cellobiose-specific phosphotransferase system component IIB
MSIYATFKDLKQEKKKKETKAKRKTVLMYHLQHSDFILVSPPAVYVINDLHMVTNLKKLVNCTQSQQY